MDAFETMLAANLSNKPRKSTQEAKTTEILTPRPPPVKSYRLPDDVFIDDHLLAIQHRMDALLVVRNK